MRENFSNGPPPESADNDKPLESKQGEKIEPLDNRADLERKRDQYQSVISVIERAIKDPTPWNFTNTCGKIIIRCEEFIYGQQNDDAHPLAMDTLSRTQEEPETLAALFLAMRFENKMKTLWEHYGKDNDKMEESVVKLLRQAKDSMQQELDKVLQKLSSFK